MRISPHKKFISILFYLFLCTLMVSCGISVNPTNNSETSQEFSFTNLLKIEEDLEINVSVNLLNPLTEGETLSLEIVDEIGGAGNNIVKHELNRIDDITYSTSLLCTNGSIITYRYSKSGSEDQTELAADGSTIRYRLIKCQDGYDPTDFISAWPGEPFSGKSGKLSGKVVDQKTSTPLDNILISISGYQTFTDYLGNFSIEKLPTGNHLLTAYAIDGSYEIFQQKADILDGLTTEALIDLKYLPEVNVTFIVTPPDDAKGAPIKMVGNLFQFGNTFTDLSGGISVSSARSPIMTRLEDGRYKHQVKLHAGNDLRYLYTLGDGYWNAEQGLPLGKNYRHIIIPGKDLIIEDNILGWRLDNQNPKVIEVTVPENTPVSESISIQFSRNDQWYEPLTMWPMAEQRWLYLLFTPFDNNNEISYRFCRNSICNLDGYPDDINEIFNIDWLNNASISHEIISWPLWQEQIAVADFEPGDSLSKDKSYFTGIELTNRYHPSYLNQINSTFQEISSKGANWIILTPSWRINPYFDYPKFDSTLPINNDIEEIIAQAQNDDLIISIYPQIDFEMTPSEWWQNNIRDEYWWQEWYREYLRFILNYAQLAEIYDLAHIIIGGEFAHPSMPGSIIPTESEIGTPGNSDEIWLGIIDEIRSIYSGQVLLSLPFEGTEIAQYDFMSSLDGFYILFSPKVSNSDDTSNLEELNSVIGSYLDNEVKQLLDSQNKSIYISMSYPSANGAAQLCVLDQNDNCTTKTYITTAQSLKSDQIDLQEQADLYSASLYEILNRDWISGLSSRGFFFPIKLQDFSSSINGKPASDILWHWYTGIK